MAQYDDLDNTKIFAYSAIFVVGTVITILFVMFVFFWMDEQQQQQKMMGTEYTQFNAVLDQQSESLNEYTVVDPVSGRFGIPIDDAKASMIKSYKNGSSAESDET